MHQFLFNCIKCIQHFKQADFIIIPTTLKQYRYHFILLKYNVNSKLKIFKD